MKHVAFALLASALSLVACSTPAILQPKTGPGTSYPCGVSGVVCVDRYAHPTGMCCWQGEVCGGDFPNIGCPAGSCCYEGTDAVGARQNHAQARAVARLP